MDPFGKLVKPVTTLRIVFFKCMKYVGLQRKPTILKYIYKNTFFKTVPSLTVKSEQQNVCTRPVSPLGRPRSPQQGHREGELVDYRFARSPFPGGGFPDSHGQGCKRKKGQGHLPGWTQHHRATADHCSFALMFRTPPVLNCFHLLNLQIFLNERTTRPK